MAKQSVKVIELQEYVDCRGATLDTSTPGLLKGVKILGLVSANGRTYPKETAARALGLYEGAKVNVDHPREPHSPRSYAERLGTLHNVRLGPGDTGLFADLRFNPKHALAEQLLWDAEHAPENVGFSHNVMARTAKHGGNVVVEEITKVVSVDLVADPATTKGLFEQYGDQEHHLGEKSMSENITLASLKADHPDLVSAIVTEALQANANSEAAKKKEAEYSAMREELDKLRAAEAMRATKTKVDTMIEEAKLPPQVVTDLFRVAMLEAKDDARRKELIDDRKALVESLASAKPKSKEQVVAEGKTGAPANQSDWVSTITN